MLGVCLALEMAHRKIQVDLYDRESQCVTQAAQRNEGKIHLGFVYGADCSGQTSHRMIDGAFSFYPLLRRWIGPALDSVLISTPFLYAVTHDSLLSVETCDQHFANIERKFLAYDQINYLGKTPPKMTKLSEKEWRQTFNPEKIQAAYKTSERAIDVRAVAKLLQKAVDSSSKITFFPDSTIQHIASKHNCWQINYTTPSQSQTKEYDIVINALWDGRIEIDHQVGLFEKPPWSYRLKYAIFIHSTEPISLPSATIIQGPYGDLVNFGQGQYYLSWYPQCMQGFAKNTTSPPPWESNLSKPKAKQLILETVNHLAEYIPLVAQINRQTMREFSVLGGIIYAGGDTDVNDPKSGLHKRYELDIKKNQTYYSINPGKYSLCPSFAYQAADQICAEQFLSATFV